jgi:uncharacterized protein
LIGLSAGILLLFNGDILGASGITSTTFLQPRRALYYPPMQWKVLFIGSFILTTQLFLASPAIADPVMHRLPIVSKLACAIAGLLVGFGTKLCNGCTSGHGICGLARLSKRSFVAVGLFMGSAFGTSFLLTGPFSSHIEFLRSKQSSPAFDDVLANVVAGISIFAAWFAYSRGNPTKGSSAPMYSNCRRKLLPAVASGALFAIGLAISGMVFPTKIFGFLNLAGILDGSFDPTLVAVMGGGIIVSFLSYQLVKGHSCLDNNIAIDCPLAMIASCDQTGKFSIPSNAAIDSQLIIGGVVFGIGWAIGGLCPGPALFHAATGNSDVVLLWWPAFLGGSYLAQYLKATLASTN